MMDMEAGDEEEFKAFCDEQECEWGDTPSESSAGPMPKRVEYLVDVILRRIKMPKEEAEDAPLGVLTRKEMRTWCLNKLGALDHEIGDAWTKEKQPGES